MGMKAGWLLLITDNQALADILNANECYKGNDPKILSSLEQSTELLCRFVEEGWSTREMGHDYLLWRPREQNTLADFFANISMDKKESWQWTWPGAKHIRSVPSYQLFTDGGRRDDETASAAWAIFIIIKGGFKLAGTGALFLTETDSFQAEVIAVELALKHWSSMRISLTENVSHEQPWPNIDLRFSNILSPITSTE